ncbi:hypothetical protein HAX54_020265 [Datura stramonium]|uniref:Uncharacterized protein n=1 Tax=Datura stramonium TaxID=4076 RepID=A0ABS8UT67_DATST|nr:hypothetical protein [Datura stramonium]
MESKTCVKFAHIIAFLLLATSFKTLMAQVERAQVSDGLKSVDESNLVCQGKQIWAELIGVPANFAKQKILEENSLISEVQIVLNGSPVPADFSCNRVRLVVNVLDIVVQIPVVS